jgi:diadenosine tetraphosphate (Ap4A) HIT family hydrolase
MGSDGGSVLTADLIWKTVFCLSVLMVAFLFYKGASIKRSENGRHTDGVADGDLPALQILSAKWGIGGDAYKDVTDIVRKHAKADSIEIPAQIGLLQDPYPGSGKQLKVLYSFAEKHEAIVQEGHNLVLPGPDHRAEELAALKQQHERELTKTVTQAANALGAEVDRRHAAIKQLEEEKANLNTRLHERSSQIESHSTEISGLRATLKAMTTSAESSMLAVQKILAEYGQNALINTRITTAAMPSIIEVIPKVTALIAYEQEAWRIQERLQNMWNNSQGPGEEAVAAFLQHPLAEMYFPPCPDKASVLYRTMAKWKVQEELKDHLWRKPDGIRTELMQCKIPTGLPIGEVLALLDAHRLALRNYTAGLLDRKSDSATIS